MTTDAPAQPTPAREPGPARDLQARLYREIGIGAVAAALRFIAQPAPGEPAAKAERSLPAVLRDDDLAA